MLLYASSFCLPVCFTDLAFVSPETHSREETSKCAITPIGLGIFRLFASFHRLAPQHSIAHSHDRQLMTIAKEPVTPSLHVPGSVRILMQISMKAKYMKQRKQVERRQSGSVDWFCPVWCGQPKFIKIPRSISAHLFERIALYDEEKRCYALLHFDAREWPRKTAWVAQEVDFTTMLGRKILAW